MSTNGSWRRYAVAIAMGLALVALAPASAADGDPFLEQCFTHTAQAGCTLLSPASGGIDAELAPGGKHLYTTIFGAPATNGVRLFDVGSDGTITHRAGAAGCYTPAGAGGCTAIGGAGNEVYDIAISPDGKNLYVPTGNALMVLNRDATTGTLSPNGCWGSAATCTTMPGNNYTLGAAISPDGTSVYVRSSNQLTVFQRDVTTGTLQLEPDGEDCFTETATASCTVAVGLANYSFGGSVSGDGKHLYLTNQTPGGVTFFIRAPNGTLAQLSGPTGGCITTNGSSGGTPNVCQVGQATLSNSWNAELDDQNEYLFVSGSAGNTVYRRDPSTGMLTQTDCLAETTPPAGCQDVLGASGMGMALTPDGTHAVLDAYSINGLSFFTFNRSTGKLTQRPGTLGCVSPTGNSGACVARTGIGGYGRIAISGDGLHAYASKQVGAVLAFELDRVPRCDNRTATVTQNNATAIPLTCTDANGDEVTLEIVTQPGAGTLGSPDQANDRVFYNPFANYTGADSFTYRGSARGAAGPAATVTINVVPPPANPPPPPPPPPAVDRKAPNTAITKRVPRSTKSRNATFRFRSTEARSTFQCKLDKKPFGPCRSPKAYRRLKRGKHTFQVRARDRAGNVDRSPAKATWTIRK